MKCEECQTDAEWLVVTEGIEWISRFCSTHLRKILPYSEVYLRK
jgi:hypothetical protein